MCDITLRKVTDFRILYVHRKYTIREILLKSCHKYVIALFVPEKLNPLNLVFRNIIENVYFFAGEIFHLTIQTAISQDRKSKLTYIFSYFLDLQTFAGCHFSAGVGRKKNLTKKCFTDSQRSTFHNWCLWSSYQLVRCAIIDSRVLSHQLSKIHVTCSFKILTNTFYWLNP